MKTQFLLLALLGSFYFLCAGCEKDPEIIIQKETITVHDTLIVVDTLTLIETIFQSLPDTATTFILVRHAETTDVGSNPSLSAAGQLRAEKLNQMLNPLHLDAVYATDFNRTKQTAQPIATAHSVAVNIYDPFAGDALLNQVLNSYPKGIVLIVGHSNTIPALLNLMVGTNTYADLAETEYDNFYVVHVPAKGDATVVHMKYGD